MMKEKQKTNLVLTIVLILGTVNCIFPTVYGSDHCV